MRIIENDTQFQLHTPSAVAIGKFDGIHKGHKALLQMILEKKRQGMKAVVFTFEPSPLELFTGQIQQELTTREEKRVLFQNMGIDVLIEYPMTRESAAIAPELFVKQILWTQMKAGFIAAGTDVSFGDKGSGDAALLYRLAKEYGYELEIIDKIKDCDGREISSTYIRRQIAEGQMERVEALMGDAYSITGTVAHGKKLGTKMGMPTVNLIPSKKKLLPPNGVYFSEVCYEARCYKSITNIGYKPTVNDEKVIGVESYLYDFAQDIYGKDITVKLFAFKRPEMKFQNVDELKCQMAKDIAEGKYYKKE